MQRIIIFGFLLCALHILQAKDTPRYPVSAIPENLKQDAYAVIRANDVVFTSRSRNTANLHEHFAVTIFNALGNHFATKRVLYDKLRKITAIKAIVYDAEGSIIKKLNHAVVAVPNGADTLWLECTNQTNPFGYQGLFTGDRKALLITENGATIVNTTRYPAEINIQSTSANVSVEISGDAKASFETTFSGFQYENGSLDVLITRQFDDKKKWLQRNLGIPSFDINSFTMKNIKNKIPVAVVKADLTMNRYATVSGKRIFLMANLMNRSTFYPREN